MTPKPHASFRALNAELRRAGFRREYSTVAGGCRMDEWQRQDNDRRTIKVQLWGDGLHRASHGIGGRETTHPTDFTDVAGMLAAIKTESERQDNLALAQIDGASE